MNLQITRLSRHLIFVILISSLLTCSAIGQQTTLEKKADPQKQAADVEAKVQKSRWDFEPDDSLPNVLLLGDSISIGYTLKVRQILKGKANVYRPVKKVKPKKANNAQPASSDQTIPEPARPKVTRPENCLGTNQGIKQIERWIGETKWDLIHFNFGLHDLKHVDANGRNSSKPDDPQQAAPEKYAEQLEKITEVLLTTNAKLIFATTTPIAPETNKPLRKPEYPPVYNEKALEVMKRHGVEINDLYASCLPMLGKIQRPQDCHFNKQGNEHLANEVAQSILKRLKDGG